MAESHGAPCSTLENFSMKKSLIALAALAATGAFAQSSVTLYGLADIAYGTKQITGNTGTTLQKQNGIMDGGLAGSRIGFRGTEDLGGGLAANIVIEQGISPTNGALFGVRTGTAGMQYDGYAASTGRFDQGTGGGYTQGTNRQTYVGLATKDMGEVRVGYQYTTLYEIATLSGFTMTSEGVIGGSQAHLHGQGAAGGTRANGISYLSPRMSGLQIGVQTGSAANRENTEWVSANTANGLTKDKAKRNSFKLDYESGPLKAAYGYTTFKFENSARAAASTNLTSVLNSGGTAVVNVLNVYGALTSFGASPNTGVSTYETKLNQLAASYDFGVAKIGGTYNKGTYKVTAATDPTFGTATSFTGMTKVGDYDFQSQRISGLYRLGAASLLAGFGTSKVEVGGATVMDLKETQYGVNYALSKRTTAYGYMGNWKNNGTAITSATSSYKAKSTIVGIAHSF